MNFASSNAYLSDEEDGYDSVEEEIDVFDDEDKSEDDNDSDEERRGEEADVRLEASAPKAKKSGGMMFPGIGDMIGAVKSSFGGIARGSAHLMSEDRSSSVRSSRQIRKKKQKIRVKKANTNVMSIEFNSLKDEAPRITGEITVCSKCSASFSIYSKLIDPSDEHPLPSEADEEAKIWLCEFCGNANPVDLFDEEIPKQETVDYVLDAGIAPKTSSSAMDIDQQQGNLVIFVVDTSGSMCSTTEVNAKNWIPKNKKLAQMLKDARREYGDQYLPGQRRDVAYISRLQSVQSAIDSQLDKISENDFVALITFSNSVKIIGDGLQETKTIGGETLTDYQRIMEIGKNFSIEHKLCDTQDKLRAKVQDLEESGATALGPAVACAVAMGEAFNEKSNGVAKVILTTDGLANIGLGALDHDREVSSAFYAQIADYAKNKGISISTISIQGEDCNLENLGILADQTNGSVDIVDPLQLDFGNVVSETIVATNVSLKVMLHSLMSFFEEDDAFGSRLDRNMGNVTAETEATFQYVFSPEAKEQARNASLTQIPFQVQIRYVDPKTKAKCIRVLTKMQAVTRDRTTAEKNVNFEVLAHNAVQLEAKLAENGRYRSAQKSSMANRVLFERAKAQNTEQQQTMTDYFHSNSENLQAHVSRNMLAEKLEGLEIEEEEDMHVGAFGVYEAPPPAASVALSSLAPSRGGAGAGAARGAARPTSVKSEATYAMRKQRRDDAFSKDMYKNKSKKKGF